MSFSCFIHLTGIDNDINMYLMFIFQPSGANLRPDGTVDMDQPVQYSEESQVGIKITIEEIFTWLNFRFYFLERCKLFSQILLNPTKA